VCLKKAFVHFCSFSLFRDRFLSNRLSALAVYLGVLFWFLLFSLFYTNLLLVTGNKIAQEEEALGHDMVFLLMLISNLLLFFIYLTINNML